jgi:hypothetical protein
MSNMAASTGVSSRTSSPMDSNSHTHKTGRKGDPRMHQAVAARMGDPNMTLFEALKAGGFTYPDDNNPNDVDNEEITLAQRKNQLSRRLRIARRQQEDFGAVATSSPTDNRNKFESLVEKQKQSFQMMQQTMELERRTSSGQFAPGGFKRQRSAASTSTPGVTANNMPKRRSLIDDEDDAEENHPAQMMAKNHPNFHPIVVPPTGPFYSQSAPLGAFNASGGVPANSSLYPPTSQGMPYFPGTFPPMTNLTPAAAAPIARHPGMAPSAMASGVAIRSLTDTAQSVGYTLEQLALALSSTRNLANIVLGEEGDTPGAAKAQKKKKHDLALELYKHEVRPVYSRSMLLAGFSADSANETSKDYLKFSWQAWQKEGRRLRDLLEEKDMLVDDAPGLGDNRAARGEPAAKKAKTRENGNRGDSAHSHSHAHAENGHSHSSSRDAESPTAGGGCHTEDGRHIHRLEKCGHKAILHQPIHGEAHIDFVVGDKVECYQGVASHQKSAWPSQYPCDCSNEYESETTKYEGDLAEAGMAPKVLDLNGIDFGGNEWNVDFVDETLTGLVRLGEGTATNSDASPSAGSPLAGDQAL